MGSPVSPVIANIYLEHLESLAIPTSPTLIRWWFRYVDDAHSNTRKDQVNQLQEHLNSRDSHTKFTLELPGTDGLPFLDTILKKPTPNSIESTVYRKPTHTESYLDTTQTCPFQQNYLLFTPSSTKLNKYVLHLSFLQRKWITFTKSYKMTGRKQSSFNKPNPNRKLNPSTGKFIEGSRVVIPYIKGLSEQYRHTLAKYKVRVLFKGTSTIKSLFMDPEDPIPGAQKTDISTTGNAQPTTAQLNT